MFIFTHTISSITILLVDVFMLVLVLLYLIPSAMDDYDPVSSYPLVFMSGDPLNTAVCVNITIVDDVDVVEPDQSFIISLTTSDPVYLTPYADSSVTIQDNDSECDRFSVAFCFSILTTISIQFTGLKALAYYVSVSV